MNAPKYDPVYRSSASIDLCDPDTFSHGFPHAAFRHLRDEAPVLWHPEREPWEKGFWSISKYDDIVAIGNNWRSFSSDRNTQIKDRNPELLARAPAAFLEMAQGSFITLDAPRHTAIRRNMNPLITAPAIARHEQAIRERVVAFLDAIGPDEIDIVDRFSRHVPIFALCRLLGLPDEAFDRLLDWGDRMVGAQDPDFNANLSQDSSGSFNPSFVAVMKEMAPYAIAQFRKRREQPTDDILSAFANAEVDGAPLSENALAGIFNLLIVAGNETTRNSFTAGLIALSEHPEQMDMLRRDPGLIPGAIDEVLRWVSPVMHFRRTATADITIRGQKIGAGEKVVIWYPSGNRDSDVFAAPDTFDITRADAKKHIAFGRGPHMCIGQYVAKLELKVMFEEILRRRPDIVSTGPAQYLRTNFVASIKRAPFRLGQQGSCPFAQPAVQEAGFAPA